MKKLLGKMINLVILAFFLAPHIASAAGGGKEAPIVIVADTRHITGLMAWWANLYNESHLYFALLTILIIPIIGVIFGLIADVVMKKIGIDLSSRELAEH
ncbi:MAG: hypothetical protein OS130_03295 [Thermodesulfobacteriota bacterium]|jgi:hypothetical protein|nr:MAG: hypothetical protein OS130_03295 [Thermodesulfobacteriota bacterium]